MTTKMHWSITLDRITQLVEEDDYVGVCKVCGKERSCCEPDARNYPCEHCEANEVFGAQELLFELCA